MTAGVVAIGLVGAPGFVSAQPGSDGELGATYRAVLGSTTGSAATGSVTITERDGEQRIVVDVAGTSPSRPHPIGLHRSDDPAARCPRPSDDRNDDGFATGAEIEDVSGPVVATATTSESTAPAELFALSTAPVADTEGNLSLDRGLVGTDRVIGELGSVQIIAYGNDLNFSNRYERAGGGRPAEATIPIACGKLELETIELPAPHAGSAGAAGTVARLYVSILDRAPEADGHSYFVSQVEGGASAIDVVWAMATSPEFERRFGAKLSASTTEWVDFVYEAVFGRRADTAGRQYWASQIDRNGLEREAMLFYFANSAEFKQITGTS